MYRNIRQFWNIAMFSHDFRMKFYDGHLWTVIYISKEILTSLTHYQILTKAEIENFFNFFSSVVTPQKVKMSQYRSHLLANKMVGYHQIFARHSTFSLNTLHTAKDWRTDTHSKTSIWNFWYRQKCLVHLMLLQDVKSLFVLLFVSFSSIFPPIVDAFDKSEL